MQERKTAFYTIKTARWTYFLKYIMELHINIIINYLTYNESFNGKK